MIRLKMYDIQMRVAIAIVKDVCKMDDIHAAQIYRLDNPRITATYGTENPVFITIHIHPHVFQVQLTGYHTDTKVCYYTEKNVIGCVIQQLEKMLEPILVSKQ